MIHRLLSNCARNHVNHGSSPLWAVQLTSKISPVGFKLRISCMALSFFEGSWGNKSILLMGIAFDSLKINGYLRGLSLTFSNR